MSIRVNLGQSVYACLILMMSGAELCVCVCVWMSLLTSLTHSNHLLDLIHG